MQVESAFTYCSYVVARIVPEPQREAIWAISVYLSGRAGRGARSRPFSRKITGPDRAA